MAARVPVGAAQPELVTANGQTSRWKHPGQQGDGEEEDGRPTPGAGPPGQLTFARIELIRGCASV